MKKPRRSTDPSPEASAADIAYLNEVVGNMERAIARSRGELRGRAPSIRLADGAFLSEGIRRLSVEAARVYALVRQGFPPDHALQVVALASAAGFPARPRAARLEDGRFLWEVARDLDPESCRMVYILLRNAHTPDAALARVLAIKAGG